MKRAFTLIELLVTIVIIGILAAIIIPAVLGDYADAYGSHNTNDPDYALYRAWLKSQGIIFPSYGTITFDEWKRLRDNNMLPVNVNSAR